MKNAATLIVATHDQAVLKSLKRVVDLGQTEEGAEKYATQDRMA